MDNNKLRTVLQISAVVGVFAIVTFYAVLFAYWATLEGGEFFGVIKGHFPATIGLPLAVMASLVIVVILEFTSGPIKFKAFGCEFEGAAAPAIMWIFCFLAMAVAIRLLW